MLHVIILHPPFYFICYCISVLYYFHIFKFIYMIFQKSSIQSSLILMDTILSTYTDRKKISNF